MDVRLKNLVQFKSSLPIIIALIFSVNISISSAAENRTYEKTLRNATEYKNKQKAINQTRRNNRANYPHVKYISARQALYLVKSGKMILIDVNAEGYYRRERHIVNAFNIPIAKLDKTKLRLNKRQIIGVYCQ